MTKLNLLPAIFLGMLLAACGQKGSLYLPESAVILEDETPTSSVEVIEETETQEGDAAEAGSSTEAPAAEPAQ